VDWASSQDREGLLTGVDVKIQLTPVPRQMVQTKDNVSVEVDR
jgi:regulator of protease activity HflC (stomatin/prohibitin superfamily)